MTEFEKGSLIVLLFVIAVIGFGTIFFIGLLIHFIEKLTKNEEKQLEKKRED